MATAPTIPAWTTARTDGQQTINLTVPAGAVAGDKLLVILNANTTSTSWLSSAPAGWTVLRSRTSLGTRSAYIMARAWDGVTTSYSITPTGVNALVSCVTLLVRGADDVSAWTKGTDWYRGSGTSSTVNTIPGVSASSPANLIAVSLEATTATETEAQVILSGGADKLLWYAGTDGLQTESIFVGETRVGGTGGSSGTQSVTYPNSQTNNGYGVHIVVPAAPDVPTSDIVVKGTSSVGSATANASTNPAVVNLAAPSQLAIGDYYVVAILLAQLTATSGNIVPPSGFTLLETNYNVPNHRIMAAFGRRIASSGDLAEAQSTGLRGGSSATRIAAVGLALQGVDIDLPLAGVGGRTVFTSTATSMAFGTIPSGDTALHFTYTNNSASTVVPIHTGQGGGATIVTATALDGGSGIVANSVLSVVRGGTGVGFTSPGATNGGGISIGLRAADADEAPGIVAVRWDGSSFHPGKITVLQTNGEEMIPTEALFQFEKHNVLSLLDDPVFYVAHRGGSTNWPEMSLRGYRNSALLGMKALEVSVFKTTDGVYVASHDSNMVRTTGVDMDIRTHTWAEINALQLSASTSDNTSQPAQPVATLDQIVAAFGATHVIFLDDKNTTNTQALLDYMDAHGGPMRWIWKEYRGGSRYLLTRARGYMNWGFFYEADGESVFAAEIPKYDLLGMEWNASQATWDRFLSTGKRVIGHIPDTLARAQTAITKGATGIMAAAPRQIFPYG